MVGLKWGGGGGGERGIIPTTHFLFPVLISGDCGVFEY